MCNIFIMICLCCFLKIFFLLFFQKKNIVVRGIFFRENNFLFFNNKCINLTNNYQIIPQFSNYAISH